MSLAVVIVVLACVALALLLQWWRLSRRRSLGIRILDGAHAKDVVFSASRPSWPRVVICMWFDSAVDSYARVNVEINKAYCSKYGYDLVVSSRPRTERGPYWERVPLLLEYLPNYDYVVWIDADAHFMLDKDLREILLRVPTKDVLLSMDIFISAWFDGRLWCGEDCTEEKALASNINSGFIVVKSTAFSASLLHHWGTDEQLLEENLVKEWSDQCTLRLLHYKNWQGFGDRSVVFPFGFLQTFDIDHNIASDALVRHGAGSGPEARLETSLAYLEELQQTGEVVA